MNPRDTMIYHLSEACEQLARTVQSLVTCPNIDMDELNVDFAHVYHHVNTAWNGRHIVEQESDMQFYHLRRFPEDEEILGLLNQRA